MVLHFELSILPAVEKSVFLVIHQAGHREQIVPMHDLHNGLWQVDVTYPNTKTLKLSYSYFVRREENIRKWEENIGRVICRQSGEPENIYLSDRWNDPSEIQNIFLKAPFTHALLAAKYKKKTINYSEHFTHEFRILAPLLQGSHAVCLLGNNPALHTWDINNPIEMRQEGLFWIAHISLPEYADLIEYKYGIYQTATKGFLYYEDGENRKFQYKNPVSSLTIITDNFFRQSQPLWRGGGVAVPVFSLRSHESVGIGEFADLKILADWAAGNRIKLIQVLPVNDTTATRTWHDSYPYAAISAFALNPVYLNLKNIGSLPEKHPAEKKYNACKERLNLLPEVDYEAVLKFKWEYVTALFKIHKDDFLPDRSFKSFFKQHQSWLIPYAVFCCLRDQYGTADYSRFGRYKIYNAKAVLDFASPRQPHYEKVAIHYFVQYHLHRQLSEAAKYAHKKGIALKGDIPIGIYRHSVEAWMYPEYFFLDMQAGAPPDAFAVKGQNWGFPTYQWVRMEADGFSWWKNRLKHLSCYFDAIRFDHILGFFRIWQIPADAMEGIMGHFHPAIPINLREMDALDIHFNQERYCKPFITPEVLKDFFGSEDSFIKKTFLDEGEKGCFQLKPAFDTQRKIATFFENRERDTNAFPGHWKLGLFDLVSNVLLFPADKDGHYFHPRFGMMQTPSFQALSSAIREKLNCLHDQYFYHRHKRFWQNEAMRKLPALKRATEMLVCGEDLGMISQSVPDTMQSLGLLSLEVQRMPKQAGREFTDIRHVPYLSVVTPGTHDMSTLREWWEEDRERTQRFYNEVLGHHGSAPYFCEPWVTKQIINQHLHAPAIWAIIQLQDLLSMSASLRRENTHDERINIPANPNHYWRYRMHISLEQLLKEESFNGVIKDMITDAGRG